ncbi:MAG: hypothetical protein ACTSWK_09125 [Promethearchaeota archaeon]
MKQRNLSVIITFLLLSSMTFSMIVSVKAGDDGYTYDYDNTYFDYGVAEGDVFEYDFLFDINFTASSTFYDAMDTWIVDMAADENFTLVDFSFEDVIEDIENMTNLDYAIQLELTEMYTKYSNWSSYDDGWEIRHKDVFNGSVRVDLNEGAGWETPEVIAVEKLEDSKPIMENYLNDTLFAEYEDLIDEQIAEVQNVSNHPDWNNFEIYQIESDREYYFENGTLDVDVPKELANGTTEPANPFPEFGGPNGLPLFFPTEMNFEEFYDYGTDMFRFELMYNLENNYSIDPFVSTETLQSILTRGGVSEIHVFEKSVGFVWNLADVDPDLINETSSTVNLSDAGIMDHIGTVAFSMEYDDDWALETFVIYAHIGLNLDTTGLTGAPNVVDEDVSFDITYTVARDGVTPPTEEDVLNGLIGENSPFDIPGFPIWFVGLFGLLSIAALVVKHRK